MAPTQISWPLWMTSTHGLGLMVGWCSSRLSARGTPRATWMSRSAGAMRVCGTRGSSPSRL
eukprot:1677841-Alexandrium_andersonii.AAC.1